MCHSFLVSLRNEFTTYWQNNKVCPTGRNNFYFFLYGFKDLVNMTKMVQIKFNTVKQTYNNLWSLSIYSEVAKHKVHV